MELYNQIINQFSNLEGSETPLSNLAHEHQFTMVETKNADDNDKYYECFRAIKEVDNFTITIWIETRDNYRSFGNDEEPYHNYISLSENGKVIHENHYTYFK